uniref:Uncharacterized protein n=1 Tax=Romanomermis culicivorax TaxID=13658 RepID=A0A915IBG7_ROMCU
MDHALFIIDMVLSGSKAKATQTHHESKTNIGEKKSHSLNKKSNKDRNEEDNNNNELKKLTEQDVITQILEKYDHRVRPRGLNASEPVGVTEKSMVCVDQQDKTKPT